MQQKLDRPYFSTSASADKCMQSATYFNSLGNGFKDQGRLDDAIACYYRAVEHNPDDAVAYNNLGNAYKFKGDLNRAGLYYQKALQANPQYADAHYNLGILYAEHGRYRDAVSAYGKAALLNPVLVEAHFNLGNVLLELGEFNEAIHSYRRVLRIDPDYAEAYNGLGTVYQEQGRLKKALACYKNHMHIKPDAGIEVKASLMLPVIFESTRAIIDARKALASNIEEMSHKALDLKDAPKQIGKTNFFLAYHGLNNRHLQEKIARFYLDASPELGWQTSLVHPHSNYDGKIKIGIISRYLRSHTIGYLNYGVVKHLDREKFHVSVFGFAGMRDKLSADFANTADQAFNLPAHLAPARQIIARQALDILLYLDIGMDPLTYFLAFSRLAPVQCTTWGHPDTTGIPNIDYYISSAMAEPSGAQAHYTEKLILFDQFPMYCQRPQIPASQIARRDLGLPDYSRLYACIQSLFKVHPDFDDIIAGILRKDPEGIILFFEGKHAQWEQLLRRRFARSFPDVCDRVRFLKRLPQDDFLAFLQISDVILDTLHFSGGYTSLLAFAMGTPIVTWPGRFMRGRLTYAWYKQMGMMDCVANDIDDYVQIALNLAQNKVLQQEMRTKIAARSHVLYENIETVRELERFFESSVTQTTASYSNDARQHRRQADVLRDQGSLNEAVQCYQKAIDVEPDHATAYNSLGNALKLKNKHAEALKCYQQAVRINPKFAEAYYNWGNIERIGGRFQAAIEKYHKAVSLRPDFAQAYCNMGITQKAVGDFNNAVNNLQQAIRLRPDLAEAHNNLGNVLNDAGQFTTAITYFRKAVALKPDYAEAFNNLGVAQFYQGQVEDALVSYDAALDLQPDFADAHWNRALAYLIMGRLKEGFQEYEWRFLKSNWQAIYSRRYDTPRWDGKAFQGKRLYIHDEQGLGDTLQFIRYLPLVKDRGGTVIMEAKKPLHGLLRSVPGIDELVERSSSAHPAVACDLCIALLSLPAIFETTLETIPNNHPYLFADPKKVAIWRQRLQSEENKVGIVWAGRPVAQTDPVGLSYRSSDIRYYAPLTQIAGVRIYGLQKGPAAGDVDRLGLGDKITNLGETFKDFSDTAAAIANLDLVISIDTSVAHLAAAMGKPTWLLLPQTADWRWLQWRTDSPWYPSMRLFRQKKLGAWDGVFAKVTHALQDRIRQWHTNGRKKFS